MDVPMDYHVCSSMLEHYQRHMTKLANVKHVHLKKWTSKFSLLYLGNYISYFNKICRICCVNTRIQSQKVWLKSVLPWLKYSIFATVVFIDTPCILVDNYKFLTD